MESARYLECLAADEARLREIAGRDLAVVVPSCPEWSVKDLVEHVALVYLHKVECMRRGAPQEWPPTAEPAPPLELLDRAYATLCAEFVARQPESPSYTWYGPDQTVGFWHRRMAQETVIHRVDAELALGEPFAPIPDDLALDGIDEVLERFLAFGTTAWAEEFGPELADADGSAVLVSSGGRRWLVRLEPSGVQISPGGDPAGVTPAGQLSGDPQAVLLWLWRRADAEAITWEGDQKALIRLRALLGSATG